MVANRVVSALIRTLRFVLMYELVMVLVLPGLNPDLLSDFGRRVSSDNAFFILLDIVFICGTYLAEDFLK